MILTFQLRAFLLFVTIGYVCIHRNWKNDLITVDYGCGKIIATSHDLGPQKVAKEGKSPYFMKIWVGEILEFRQNNVNSCLWFP